MSTGETLLLHLKPELTSLTSGVIKVTLVTRGYATLIAPAGSLKLWGFYFELAQLGLTWITVADNGEKTVSSKRHRSPQLLQRGVLFIPCGYSALLVYIAQPASVRQ